MRPPCCIYFFKQIQKKKHLISAFSILEVTIAIALTGLLSALVFGAMNRFNEQIKNETTIKNELNNWFIVRSNLWMDLDAADSIVVKNNTATLYFSDRVIEYKIEESKFMRQIKEDITYLNMEIDRIELIANKNRNYVRFTFIWKDEEMQLEYPLKTTLADKVNTYFLSEQWQKQ